jgi:hypothetical protein
MRSKATFLTGFAAGYVLGSRAGRARYEQIRQASRSFMANPTVQSTASTLQHQAEDALGTAKDKAASKLGDKLSEKKPSWLGSGSGETASGPATASTNGHPA